MLNECSVECSSARLDTFSPPTLETGISDGKYVEIHTISSLDSNGPFEFKIPGDSRDMIYLPDTHVYLRCRVEKKSGDDNATAEPVNLFPQSLFRQIELQLNGTQVNDASNTYAYRAYLETLLSYGSEAKKSHLSLRGWSDSNPVLTKEYYFPLHMDMCHQSRVLVNGVDVTIRMIRNEDNFSLFSVAGSYSIKIDHISLFLRRLTPSDDLYLTQEKHFKDGKRALYPISRVLVRTFTVPRGNKDGSKNNLFLGQLPKRVIIGCVEQDAINGSLGKNPWHFSHFNTNFVALYVNGEQLPSKAYTPDFANRLYARSFASLYEGTNIFYGNTGLAIDYDSYLNDNHVLYAWDLTSDGCGADHLHPTRRGDIRLELRFAENLAQPISVIVYGEFDNLIMIDRSRNVISDFNG